MNTAKSEARSQRLRDLYQLWDKYDSWALDECIALAAGIDPDQWLDKNGPLHAIEKSNYSQIANIVTRAISVTLTVLPDDPERVLKKVFVKWAAECIAELCTDEFKNFFPVTENNDGSFALATRKPNSRKTKGKHFRQTRIKSYLEAKGLGDGPIPNTREELYQRFFEDNPDVHNITLSTFEKDLSELNIEFKRGRRSSW